MAEDCWKGPQRIWTMIVEIAQAPCSNFICHKFGFLPNMGWFFGLGDPSKKCVTTPRKVTNWTVVYYKSTLEMGKPPQNDMQQLRHLLAAKYARLRLKKKSLGNITLLSALFDSKLKLGSLHKSRLWILWKPNSCDITNKQKNRYGI